jgi:hypothetical protein
VLTLNKEEKMMDDLFEKYYETGLKIRAICIELGYDMETFQVLMNIHVKGKEYFLNSNKEFMNKVFNLMSPEAQERIERQSNETLKKCIIGKDLENLKNEDVPEGFFTNQLKNFQRLHNDKEYLTDMLITYYGEILPLLNEYTIEKVEEVFRNSRRKKYEL